MWDRGEGDTVASQSWLEKSYTGAHGTQYSEENALKYDRIFCQNFFLKTILVFIAAVQAVVQLHVTNAASMKAQALLLLCIRTASALLTRRSRAAHACSVKPALDILDIEENDFQQSTVFSASMSLSAVFII